jgi:hypothetical protein
LDAAIKAFYACMCKVLSDYAASPVHLAGLLHSQLQAHDITGAVAVGVLPAKMLFHTSFELMQKLPH